MKNKTIFIYINDGFAHRYLLRSDVFKTLRDRTDLRIIILAHNANEDGFRDFYESENIFVEEISDDDYASYLASSKLQRILIQIRAHVLNGKEDTTTIDDFKEIFIIQNRWSKDDGLLRHILGIFFRITTEILKRSSALRNLLIQFEQICLTPKIHTDLFEKYNPDLLLVTGLTGFLYNEFIAREAIKNNVRVCNIVLSWDNTSGNGMPGYVPDSVISWTDNMKKELINMNDIPEEKIHVGGVAHWDSYYKDQILIKKEELFDKLGLNHDRKVIFYATKSPRRFPWGPNLIESIAIEIEKGTFSDDVQLLVRIHPLHFRRKDGSYVFQEILDEYARIESKYDSIVLNMPKLQSKQMDFDMADSEISLVASILQHSDIMINMFSTMAIEAAIFDLPVVNMAIRDMCQGDIKNTKQDIMIDYRQTHNQRVIQSGGCRTAFTMEELIDYINLYLSDPNEDSKGREYICTHEAGPFPGHAGENIGNIIIQLLND